MQQERLMAGREGEKLGNVLPLLCMYAGWPPLYLSSLCREVFRRTSNAPEVSIRPVKTIGSDQSSYQCG